ncbi:thioesterase [Seongchinamella sediminis]|uniref:Thioesterase n=1 Tax=Seongchinamella sediminis TaxID=2283635 RepID=A0A3L7DSX6_9GAMM|nr:thioesterase family protein [Seongchinamella sediminis]RLQ20648.1 thioesterase [Seongchinamella sediminis]
MEQSQWFAAHRDAVRPEWIDYNGHMSEAYHVLVFGYATDALLDAIGIDETFRQQQQCSVYTLEAHIRYLAEVPVGVPLQVVTVVTDSDHKRLHVNHVMLRSDSGAVVASTELMLMYVDTEAGSSADFPAAIGAEIARFRQRYPGRPERGDMGRRIAIRR